MKPGAVKWGGCEHLPRGLRLTWVQEKTSEEAARERRFTGRGATTGPAPLLPCQEAREANERVSASTLCDEMSGWTATRWERKQKKRIGMCGKQRAPAASHAASVPCSCQALVGNAFLTGAWGRTAGRTGGRDALPRKGTASASFLGQMRMSSAQQVLTSSSSEWQPQWGPQRAPVSARSHAIGRDGQAGQKQKKQK